MQRALVKRSYGELSSAGARCDMRSLNPSSTVIENVLRDCEEKRNAACAYFFFDARAEQSDLSMHHQMLRSLIRQLSLRATSVPAALVGIYGDGLQKPSIASLEIALQQLIESFEQTYIVIDGIDECIDREKLMAWIGNLLQRNISKLHVVLSSRQEHDIEESFKNIPRLVRVPLVGEAVDADVAKHLNAIFSRLTKWDSPIRNRVKDVLITDAHGTCVHSSPAG